MKYTIVSFYPNDINEQKQGIHPGDYKLSACKDLNKPQVLIVDNAYHYVDIGENRPPLKNWKPAEEVANSVVNDLLRAMFGVTPGVLQPAVFCIEGEFTADDVLKKHGSLCAKYKQLQHDWMTELVKVADDEWSKRPGAHRLITKDARIACQTLGLNRPWNLDSAVLPKLSACPFCYVTVDERATICHNCKSKIEKK
jgi:hypothetical protein